MSVVRYGSYAHNAGEVFWTDAVQTQIVQGVAVTRTITVSLDIKVFGDTAALIAASMGSMQNAYWQPGRDLTLSDDNGTVLRSLRSAGSLSGVQCVEGPSLVGTTPGEFTTYATLRATFQATFQAQAGQALVYDWTQSLSIEGGGPLYVWQPAISGPPLKVMVQDQTTYRATQTGSAKGLLSYPPVPPPVFGVGALMGNPQITRASPLRNGQGFTEWPVTWSYQFESASPLIGLPGLPP